MSELETGFRLAEVWELLRRRILWMVLFAILGVVLAVVVFSATPSVYSATSRVQIQAVNTDPFTSTSPDADILDVVTERDLVKSDATAKDVIEVLDLDVNARELLQDVTVTSAEDSSVLEITYVSDEAEHTRDVANQFARAYLEERARHYATLKDRDLMQIVTQLADVDRQIADTDPANLAALTELRATRTEINLRRLQLERVDTEAVGQVFREASLPPSVLSKAALGMAVGVFGLTLMAGLVLSWMIDRRDSHGGGRRTVQRLVPEAGIRVLPRIKRTKDGKPTPEMDAAVDRLAVELTSDHPPGEVASVVLTSTDREPPIRLAEDIASSLNFAGIPTLFVLAGPTSIEVPQAQVIPSFSDIIDGAPLAGPPGLPAEAFTPGDEDAEVLSPAPTAAGPGLITWLRPAGSVEASGLLRRGVVEALFVRAAEEGFDAVIMLTVSPTHNAAAAALGQWSNRTVVVVNGSSDGIADTLRTLRDADARITEVVWA